MCQINVSTEKVGARIYVVGNTFAIKDRLKAAGCHWDGERKQWWIGAAKADNIAFLTSSLDGHEVKEDLSQCSVYGKVSYTGKSGKAGTYYVIGSSDKSGTPRLRLTNLQGAIDFWADESACQWTKRYEARNVGFQGYGNRRNNTYEYQKLGSIQRYAQRMKSNPQFREEEETRRSISACGRRGCRRLQGEWCSDCHDEE